MRQKVTILSLALAFCAVLAYISISVLTFDTSIEENRTVMAHHLFDELYGKFEKPVTVSKSISENELLIDLLKNEMQYESSEIEKIVCGYLSSISKTFKFYPVNIVSEKTRRYYTTNGIAKILDHENEPNDDWYQFFVNSNKKMKIVIDRDKVYDYRWALFINRRIEDEGKLLGMSGIGLFIDDLREEMLKEEKKHGVKVTFINKDGLVQMDTNEANIENTYISEALTDGAENGDFVYTVKKNGSWRITSYIPEIEWYLVIQDFDPSDDDSLLPAFIVLFILTILLFALLIKAQIKKNQPEIIRNDNPHDFLTGLPNRNYLNEAYGEQGIFNTTRYKSLAMLDIDRFKTTNETRDGNKLLLGIVELTKKCVNEHGIIFRWAGDEFVFFLEFDITEAEKRFNDLCREIKEKLDVTISVGIVKVDLTESIKTNYHRAVQLCYKVKANGGNGVSIEE